MVQSVLDSLKQQRKAFDENAIKLLVILRNQAKRFLKETKWGSHLKVTYTNQVPIWLTELRPCSDLHVAVARMGSLF